MASLSLVLTRYGYLEALLCKRLRTKAVVSCLFSSGVGGVGAGSGGGVSGIGRGGNS